MSARLLVILLLASCLCSVSAATLQIGTADNEKMLLLSLGEDGQAASSYPRAPAPSLIAQSTGISIEEAERQLAILKRLCEQGLVSKEECQSRQASILDKILSSGASPSTLPSLSIIPADALGFVGVRNLKQLDDRFGAIIRDLGLVQLLPIRAMVTTLRQFGAMHKGFDENGSIFLVMLNMDTPDRWAGRTAIIVPVNDPNALLESLSPEPPIEGVSPVRLFDKQAFAMAKNNSLIIALTPVAAKALANENRGLDTRLQPQDIKAMSNMDFVFWANAVKGLNMFKPLIENLTSGYNVTSTTAAQSVQRIPPTLMLTYIHMIQEGASTVFGGISLGERGVGLRLAMSMLPDSDLAKLLGSQETNRESLLDILPDEDYGFAFGQIITAEQAKEGVKWLSSLFEAQEIRQGVGQETARNLKTSLQGWYGMMRGIAFSVSSPPAEQDGLIALRAVCEVTESGRWMSYLRDVIAQVKTIKADSEEVKAALRAITYKLGATSFEGVSVDELYMDLSQITNQEEVDRTKRLFGSDGLLMRIGVIDATRVAITFGGGEAAMASTIAQAKTGKAPLIDNLGIKQVATHLPMHKLSEGYLALDRIITTAQNISKAMGEREAIPISASELKAPIAFATSGDKTSLQFDLYHPWKELLALGKIFGLRGTQR